jgi:hypothetical protein
MPTSSEREHCKKRDAIKTLTENEKYAKMTFNYIDYENRGFRRKNDETNIQKCREESTQNSSSEWLNVINEIIKIGENGLSCIFCSNVWMHKILEVSHQISRLITFLKNL